eukprot:3270784-Rhodomonas_salina.1
MLPPRRVCDASATRTWNLSCMMQVYAGHNTDGGSEKPLAIWTWPTIRGPCFALAHVSNSDES